MAKKKAKKKAAVKGAAEQSLAREVESEASIEDANDRDDRPMPCRVPGFKGLRDQHPIFVIMHTANKVIEIDKHLATHPGVDVRSALLKRMRAANLDLGAACWKLQDQIDNNYPTPYQSVDGSL